MEDGVCCGAQPGAARPPALPVERLSLPAATESEATWIHGFHFNPMPEEETRVARSELRILLFPDARVLHKTITHKDQPSLTATAHMLRAGHDRAHDRADAGAAASPPARPREARFQEGGEDDDDDVFEENGKANGNGKGWPTKGARGMGGAKGCAGLADGKGSYGSTSYDSAEGAEGAGVCSREGRPSLSGFAAAAAATNAVRDCGNAARSIFSN
eukprot:629685-Prorocentrum_minimum.AAC.1